MSELRKVDPMSSEPEPCWDCRATYWACSHPDCHGFHCKCDKEPCR